MSRFFVPTENFTENSVRITGSDVRHLKNVLRKQAGDVLTLSDSRGRLCEAEIISLNDEKIECRIISEKEDVSEPRVPVVLLQGVPKGDKAELIVQKTVELGVSEIRPVLTERTVVKLDNKVDREKKTARWQKIAAEASKQCGRGSVPTVADVTDFRAAVESLNCGEYAEYLKLIPYENETENTLKAELRREIPNGTGGIIIFIGPEGGFSQKEVDFCVENGFRPVTLGKRILRTETAGLAALAAIRYEIGD